MNKELMEQIYTDEVLRLKEENDAKMQELIERDIGRCYKLEPQRITPSGVEYTFTKDDGNKLRYGLIPPLAEKEMVKVLTFGAKKYSPDNWKHVDDLRRYIDATLRHISEYRLGNTTDDETGYHHLAHAMCCLSFIVDLELSDG